MHVLDKCGFLNGGVIPAHASFPNLQADGLCDVVSYSHDIEPRA
jgi:hypothetical protein